MKTKQLKIEVKIPKKKRKSEYIMCRITPELKQRFEDRLKQEGISQQSAIEFLIQFYLGE